MRHVPDVDSSEVREVLKNKGLRYSRPRSIILRFFREKDRHASAEDVYLELRRDGENLSLSTVYLNLGVLEEAGLIRAFRGVNGEALYDSNVTPHYHLICEETGEVVDVPAPTIEGKTLGQYLKARIEAITGWQVEEPHIQLRGRPPAGAASDGEVQ